MNIVQRQKERKQRLIDILNELIELGVHNDSTLAAQLKTNRQRIKAIRTGATKLLSSDIIDLYLNRIEQGKN